MKSLPPILALTFLALTLTNCSGQLSSARIASRLEPSIVRLFYRNQTGHGTGFFVRGERGVCTLLTAAHVVKKEGERLLQTKDGKVWQVANVEIFPSNIDLALVTFQAVGEICNYPALKIGNSENLKKGSLIYIDGFPIRGGKLVSQFVEGKVSALDSLARGYGVSYQAMTVGGMSGAPVVDEKGEVVAVHGMRDLEVVQNFSSLQGSLSESERQTFQQAVERVNGVQSLGFAWGIPINFFRESDFYYGDVSGLNLWVLFCGGVMFGGGLVFVGLRYFQTPQVSVEKERELERRLNTESQKQRELEKQLENERQKRQEAKVEIETLQVAVKRQGELERQLTDEQLRRQEVEERLKSVQNIQGQGKRELERQLENERRKRQEVEVEIETLQVALQRQGELERQLKGEQLRRQKVEERLKSVQNIQGQGKRELERQLGNERRKRQEVEVEIETLQVAVKRQGELERQLKGEQLRRQEVEARLKSVQNNQGHGKREVEREGEVKSQQGKPRSSVDVPLVSAKGVDYTKLRDLLAGGKWKEADKETGRVMLKVAGRESEGWLNIEDIENFPCQDLGTIDKLWVKYSNGKFGFSVQKQIYQGLGGTKQYDEKVWKAFCDKVGWRQGGKWLYYDDLTFDISTHLGHLPYTSVLPKRSLTWVGLRRFGVVYCILFSRAETCIL